MNNEPSYIIIDLNGVRINIRLRSVATLPPLVPKMTGSWRLAECTSPIVSCDAEVCGAERDSIRMIQGHMH